MAGLGRIPGQYNLIIRESYQTFEHQIPVEEFLQRLKEDDIPNKVSIVGLEDALQNDDLADELARRMDQRDDDLAYQSPTIQFVVEGTFHRSGKTYDLRYNDKLYSLQQIFGPQLERKEEGDWLVAPF